MKTRNLSRSAPTLRAVQNGRPPCHHWAENHRRVCKAIILRIDSQRRIAGLWPRILGYNVCLSVLLGICSRVLYSVFNVDLGRTSTSSTSTVIRDFLSNISRQTIVFHDILGVGIHRKDALARAKTGPLIVARLGPWTQPTIARLGLPGTHVQVVSGADVPQPHAHPASTRSIANEPSLFPLLK